MSKLIIPKTTTAYRESAIPKAADLLFDTDINKMVIGDGVTPGGIVINATGGTAGAVDPGFHIEVYGTTVGLKRFNAIENLVSGGTVYSGHAYKLNATSVSGTTVYAEEFAEGSFGLESHLEIMVNGVGYLHLGQKTTAGSETAPFVLVGALEPDAMNNVTVRFHDGVAVMTVEDHIGGYVVISGGTSQATAGTLPYALVNTGSDASPYITFSSELNGTTFDVTGVTVTTERHVVGNGYNETKITGDVNVGTSGTLTMAAVGLQNVIVSSGTLTFGDVYIPNSATVAVSGGGLVVEKVTGNGGTIDLGGTNVVIPSGTTASASGCTFSGGAGGSRDAGGAFQLYGSGASATLTSCTITGNSAYNGGGLYVFGSNAILTLTDCVVSGNTGGAAKDLMCQAYATVKINGGIIGNTAIAGGNGSVIIQGTVSLDMVSAIGSGGTVTISSGATLDLTGNTNPTPVAPGGGITFESGGATVLYSSGAVSGSYMMDNVTLPAGAKLTNTSVVDLGGTHVTLTSGTTAYASGCTLSGGSNTSTGGAFVVSTGAVATFDHVVFSGNNTQNAGGRSLSIKGAVVTITGCTFARTPDQNALMDNATGATLVCSDTQMPIATLLNGTIPKVVITGSCTQKVGSIVGSGGGTTGGGTVFIESGAVFDMTGNSRLPYPVIQTGGGIVVAGGDSTKSATIINSAGTSISIAGGTYSKLMEDGTIE